MSQSHEDERAEDWEAPWFARWLPGSRRPPELRGIAVLLHGLNFHPDGMSGLAKLLAAEGFASLLVSLRGHGDNHAPSGVGSSREELRMEAFKSVSHEGWKREVAEAAGVARARADVEGVPLILAAFSLGAALGIELDCEPTKRIRFDGYLLFAPALSMHWYVDIMLRMMAPFGGLVLPSAAPLVAANPGTPSEAYHAILACVKELARTESGCIRSPGLIFIDSKDEIVSLRGVRRWVMRMRLENWRIVPIHRELAGDRGDFHHLVVDAERIDPSLWGQMSRQIIEFVRGLRDGESGQISELDAGL